MDINAIMKKIELKGKKENSDESYVIDLCDEVLNEKASRQHRFDFLRGDSMKSGKQGRKLPVDAYYISKKIVVEYYEKQHTEKVYFFDKPERKTVSGVPRGEQRKIYDKRRAEVLPQHGIQFVIISYNDFNYDKNKRIIRDKKHDLEVIKKKLANV